MDPDSHTSNILVERELRRRLLEVERLLSRAEEQNKILREQNRRLLDVERLLSRAEEQSKIFHSRSDKFRQLLSEAEAKNLQEKLAYLDLENKYERERTMRINLVGWCTFFHAKTHWVDF
jgi:hypothetical protein